MSKKGRLGEKRSLGYVFIHQVLLTRRSLLENSSNVLHSYGLFGAKNVSNLLRPGQRFLVVDGVL